MPLIRLGRLGRHKELISNEIINEVSPFRQHLINLDKIKERNSKRPLITAKLYAGKYENEIYNVRGHTKKELIDNCIRIVGCYFEPRVYLLPRKLEYPNKARHYKIVGVQGYRGKFMVMYDL